MANYTDAEIREFVASIKGFEPYKKSAEIISQLLLRIERLEKRRSKKKAADSLTATVIPQR